MTAFIIFAAKYLVVLIGLGAAASLLFAAERRKLLYTLLLALPIGYALARLLGIFVSHEQPFAAEGFEPIIPHAINNSFPSDHMLMAGIFASVAFLNNRLFGLLCWSLALLVGAARVAAGLHYPVDIAASIVLAVCAVWAARQCLALVRHAA